MTSVETYWKGVNEVISPATLSDGYLSFGKNIRCEDGIIKTRYGHQKTVITNSTTDGYDPVPLGTIYGQVDFVTSNGIRFSMAFGATKAYLCKFGSFRREIDYPAGVTLSSRIVAFQAENEIRVMRGLGLVPMRWEDGNAAFELVRQDDVGDGGYVRMASGQYALYFYNRIWVLDDDTVKPSLIGEFDIYDPTFELQADTGSNDIGTGLYVFDKSTLIVTKKKSVYAIVNITDDLAYMELVRISDAVGCEAPQAVFSDSGQLFLPTTNGIFVVSQSYDTRIQASAVAMTEPIRESYEAIDFSRFGETVGTSYDGYYLMAAPVPSETGLSRVFVYSLKTKEWMGYDEAVEAFDVCGFTKLELGGQLVLAAVSKTGYIYLYAWSNDFYDGYGSANADNGVESIAITRGYNYDGVNKSVHSLIHVGMRTINSKYSVGYQLDGVNENGTYATDVTLSNTKYRVVGKADWDSSNANLDFLNPHRGDYSIYSSDGGYYLDRVDTNSFSILLESGDELLLENGDSIQVENNGGVIITGNPYIYLDKLQSSTHKLRMSKHGTYFQVVIHNKRGHLQVNGIAVDGIEIADSITKGKTI